eukprot:gene9049-10015_t
MAEQTKKNIVITGVTKGLGLAMTEYFQSPSHLDISNDSEVAAWADTVHENFGPADFLINNASIINTNARLWEISADEFDKVVDINIKGTVNCIRHFVPQMVKKGAGVIVNFSSTWGKSVSSEVAPYCCTKWGIEGLSKSLALELPSPMTCVPLNPGIINTDMLQTTFGNHASAYCTPKQWVQKAGPMILKINRNMNGKSLDV